MGLGDDVPTLCANKDIIAEVSKQCLAARRHVQRALARSRPRGRPRLQRPAHPACPRLSSGHERRALATWLRKGCCGGAAVLAPKSPMPPLLAKSRRCHCPCGPAGVQAQAGGVRDPQEAGPRGGDVDPRQRPAHSGDEAQAHPHRHRGMATRGHTWPRRHSLQQRTASAPAHPRGAQAALGGSALAGRGGKPLGTPPPPRVLEPAASIASDPIADNYPGCQAQGRARQALRVGAPHTPPPYLLPRP